MAHKVFSQELVPSLKAYDAIRCSPKDLRPDPVLNGRVKLPDVARFKLDFLDPRIGQVQPITIKKVDGLPVIVDGVTRWRAALEITEEGTGPHEGGAFYLKCQYVVAKAPVDYFILTVKANIRNDPKPEDNAHNISLFIHNFGLEEADIAGRIYGRFTLDGSPDVAWLQEQLAYADLAPEALDALRDGRIKSSKAAVALSKLSAELQRQKLAEVPSGGKLTVAAIKRATSPNGTGTASEGHAAPPAPPVRKWDKLAFRALIQEYLEMDIPQKIAGLTCENAIRVVLGEILDELQ